MKRKIRLFAIGVLLGTYLCIGTAFASTEVGPGIEKPASASDIAISETYNVYVRGVSAETEAEVNSALSKIDTDALKKFNEAGGKIYLKDHVYYNGVEVNGLCTYSDKMILVSTHNIGNSYSVDTISDILLHEFGHYVFECSPMSDTQRSEINQVYADWNEYNPYFYNVHETYAQLYRYVKSNSNFMDYLSNATKQTVLDIEDQV